MCSSPPLHNVTADCSWSCASSLHPTASTFNDQFCSCVRWTQVKVLLVWLSIFSGRLCWCLRTYALWNRARWLLMLGVPAIVTESVVVLCAWMKVSYIPIPTGIRQACLASPGAGFWSIMAWAVPFGFDTTMSLLSIVRAMRVSRKLKTPLTTQIIRDGAKTYIYMTMTMSDHFAGFGYYGCAPLGCSYPRFSLITSQADDSHIRHVFDDVFGASSTELLVTLVSHQ